MTTSNSYNFLLTRDNIIDLAHQHIGAVGEGVSANSSQISEAANLLNMIVKVRAADGMPLWALKRGIILPFSGASSIATDSHVVVSYDTTTLTADSAATDTTLTVDSISGFSASDQIGIELDDGSIDWTTINGAPSGSTITITTGVTSAASTGNRVYGYTASSDRIQKPIRILDANLLTVSDGSSRRVTVEPRQIYYDLGNRTTEGDPTMIYYDRASTAATNLDNGSIFVWPRFPGGTKVIEFTYHRPFQDFDATGDHPDFPQAFFLPLMLELAALLGPKFGVSIEERNALKAEAKAYREEALSSDDSEGSVILERAGPHGS